MTWSAEQVLALAPDASSVAAGRRLATPGPWQSTGATSGAVWGLCSGSGKNPYVTVVDLTGPAYSCSCPSRKFPCKHALALLLLWAGGQVPAADAPADFAQTWLAGRAERAARPARTDKPVDEAASRKRAEQRADRVAAGVAELERWLHDQVTHGLAGADRGGYRQFEQVATRLVDAQAPGLADSVRRLAGIAASGDGWPARLLDELALLHVLADAATRLDDLPEPLAAVVRRRIGFPTRTQDVLASPGQRDTWAVLAVTDSTEGRLAVRRAHVHGQTSGRDAVVVSFAAGGQPLDASLLPGTVVDADAHTYPGDPSRVLLGTRHAEPTALVAPPSGASVRAAARAWAQCLTDDPWATSVPLTLGPVHVGIDEHTGAWVQDESGRVPVVPGAEPWTVLAVSGGQPVLLAVDWTPRGVAPRAVWFERELVAL